MRVEVRVSPAWMLQIQSVLDRISHLLRPCILRPEHWALGGEGWLALRGCCLQEAGQAGMQALGQRLPGSRLPGAAGLQVLGGVYQLAAAPGPEQSLGSRPEELSKMWSGPCCAAPHLLPGWMAKIASSRRSLTSRHAFRYAST